MDLGNGVNQPITTMTGADGGYAFTSLPAGNGYSVQVIDTFGILTGYQVTALGTAGADNNNQAQPYTVNLATASSINMTADFGYWLPGGTIGDYVWYDANKDALQDVGEPGLGNVTVRLVEDTNNNNSLDATDVVVATTTTDANGGYIFKDLLPGTYFVDVTDTGKVLESPTGTPYTHTTGSESQADPYKVVLAASQVVHNADFGYYLPADTGKAVVGDTVWWDTNQNGTRDPGEAGIPGATVVLRDPAGRAGGVDDDGSERQLPVHERESWDVLRGRDDAAGEQHAIAGCAGSDGGVPGVGGRAVPGCGHRVCADGGHGDGGRHGVERHGTPPNGQNGVLDSGEPGLPGVTVRLLDTSGNVIATTTTDTSGNYSFVVPAGNYLVEVTDTHNVLDDYTDSPLGNQTADQTNKAQPYPITATVGTPNMKGDFGYYQSVTTPAGVIGNQVWYETDHDGLYEPQNGEVGVAGVVVQLTPPAGVDLGNGVNQPITTMTGADGGYAFTSLPAGNGYSVQVIDTFGILTGYQVTALGTAGADNNNQAQPYTVNLATASSINMTADFGYWLPGGTIGDYVWYDASRDALQDVGEPGLGNVTVRLVEDTNNNNSLDATDVVVATTTTDANGGYIFKDLLPGTYFVDVTDTGKVLESPTGTPYTHTTGSESQADPYKVVLAASQVVHNADFGYYLPADAGKAVIGDTVWWDINQNGTRDPGEAGIPNIEVALKRPDGTVVGSSTFTDQNGNYLFTNVPPGTYYVDVLTPPLASLPSPAAPDPTMQFTVAADQQYLDADIGFVPNQQRPPATIGGTVWNDTLAPDGSFALNEPGIPGVTVSLLDSSGNIIATTTTDTNGDYTFKVPAGSYAVVVSDTHNVLDDYTVSPLGNQANDSTNKLQPYPVTVFDGETNRKGDFGYYRNVTTPAGVIGNQVWYETDHDGVYEPQNGEIGVAGVVVQLTPPPGVDAGAGPGVAITTMTGADGGYAFTSLPAGNGYSVQVIDTFGILTGYQVTTLGANQGQDNNNQDQQPNGYSVVLASQRHQPHSGLRLLDSGRRDR